MYNTTTFPKLHGLGQNPHLTHTRTSAVTTAWGVDWDEDYIARSTSNLPAEKLAFETLEKKWRDQEKVCLPQYFSSFGLLNAKRFTEDLRAKALKDAKRGNHMAPTRGEAEAIKLLLGIMRDLAPVLTAVFDHGDTTYTVCTPPAKEEWGRSESSVIDLWKRRNFHHGVTKSRDKNKRAAIGMVFAFLCVLGDSVVKRCLSFFLGEA